MDRPTAARLTELWGLSTMPAENVAFAQTYVDTKIGSDGKPLCTAMIGMVTDDPETFSDLHTLPTDELWHFYLGDPIELLLLDPDGTDELVLLGQDVLAGQVVHTVVPAGGCMGARLLPAASTVSTDARWLRASSCRTFRPREQRI